MSADNKDGGPAFPVFPPRDHATVAVGLSMRDYFAAKAMHAIVTTPKKVGNANKNEADVARLSYLLADAMLKARQS